MTVLFFWVAAVSALDFILALSDKSRARRGARRVPEATLLAVALAGGSPGLALGMLVARHKTRKPGFLLAFAAILALQAGAVYAAFALI